MLQSTENLIKRMCMETPEEIITLSLFKSYDPLNKQ